MTQDELPELEPLPLDPSELGDPEPAPEEAPISLVDAPVVEEHTQKIQAFGRAGQHTEKQYRRALNLDGTGATRCKIFHCKMAPGPIDYMEQQINEWIDTHEIEVKFVSQSVGSLEGKTTELNLFMSVWF